MAGVKIQAPFVWDGKPVMDTFDHWTFEVDTWIELMVLDDRLAMKCIVNFMSGEASKFFMDHVSTNLRKWTIKDVYRALFSYCFPADFKLRLRKRLMNAYQGKKTVRDFVRDIKSLAKRFPDITEWHLVQILWDGVEHYIRVKWLERGMVPEESGFEKLVKWALRFEKSKEALDREKHDWNPKPEGRTWGRFKNRTCGNEPWTPPNEDSSEASGAKLNGGKQDRYSKPNQAAGKPTQDKPKGKSGRPKEKQKWTPKEMDRMRAEDRCFTCKEIGHQSRNCPDKHKAKSPQQKVSVGAARYDYLNSIGVGSATRPDGQKPAQAASVRIEDTDAQDELPDPSTLDKSVDKIWLTMPASEVCSYVKKLWMTTYPPDEAIAEGMVPDERFTVMEYGIGFEVTDWLRCEVPYMVTREDLTRLNFSVGDVVNDAWDRHLSAPRNRSCFYGDEPDHEYPALSWLQYRFAGALTDLDNIHMDDAVDRILVDPATGGYLIFDQGTADHYFVTHVEIRQPGFSAREVLSKPPPDDTPSIESVERIRRRRRIMSRPRCAIISVRKSQPHRKHCRTENDERTHDHMSRTAMCEKARDGNRVLPRQIIVEATINGQAVRALLDTGSMMDFISTKLVDQLKIKTEVLDKPVPLYMAILGSRSVVNRAATVSFAYQGIEGQRSFDVCNLDAYDVVLGTPFLFQHKVAVGFNPTRVIIGSISPLPLEGEMMPFGEWSGRR
ncbi:hypothetical protein K438DRAFT_2072545 [Mycena galopus ATCC 62051]|nr:hypothetical protein K438DRAFT_2072545 [Mycena galopus ATCC 62051]